MSSDEGKLCEEKIPKQVKEINKSFGLSLVQRLKPVHKGLSGRGNLLLRLGVLKGSSKCTMSNKKTIFSEPESASNESLQSGISPQHNMFYTSPLKTLR